MKLRAIDVFTPNGVPEHTYVMRRDADREARLTHALSTPNAVVSVSGPSKSGKTVLIEKVVGNLVGKDRLIKVSGAEVRSGPDLWSTVMASMGSPASVSEQTTTSTANRTAGELGGKGGLPFIAEASTKASHDYTRTTSGSRTETRATDGLNEIVNKIGNGTYILLLDDFHYIPGEAQVDVARQIKVAAERGVTICVATVPHRAGDVLRSNHELRGRLARIDTSLWSLNELEQIALLGFRKLLVDLSSLQVTRLAKEACGSPQLMQRICLDFCFNFGIEAECNERRQIDDVPPDRLEAILDDASAHTDFGDLVENLHHAAKTRGRAPRQYGFFDDSEGDIYRAILLAICGDELTTTHSLSDLMERIHVVCLSDPPSAQSVVKACRELDAIARRLAPSERVLEWDDRHLGGALTIVDPYFLFYLRSSSKLETLGDALAS